MRGRSRLWKTGSELREELPDAKRAVVGDGRPRGPDDRTPETSRGRVGQGSDDDRGGRSDRAASPADRSRLGCASVPGIEVGDGGWASAAGRTEGSR